MLVLHEVLAFRRAGDYRAAQAAALAGAGTDPRVQIELGRLLEEFAAYDDAEAALIPLVDHEDASIRAGALLRLVAVRRGQGRLRDAAEVAVRAVDAGGGCEALIAAAGAVHDVKGPDAASALLERAVADCPEEEAERTLLAGAIASQDRRAGRWDEAAVGFQQAIPRAEAVFGPSSFEVLGLLNELGITFKFSGRFDEAADLYRRCLAMLERAFGTENHPDVASLYHNLGGLAHARGDLEEAERLARHGLVIRQAVLGQDHLAVALDRGAPASILDGLERHDEAETLLREALPVLEAEFGPEHHEVAVTLNNLAAIAQRRGDLAAAEALYRRALTIKEKALGPNASETGYTLNNLAVVRRKLGDLEGAEALYRRALAIFEGSLEPTHPSITITLRNLAKLMDAAGRVGEADVLRGRIRPAEATNEDG